MHFQSKLNIEVVEMFKFGKQHSLRILYIKPESCEKA